MDRHVTDMNTDTILRGLTQGEIYKLAKAALIAEACHQADYSADDVELQDKARDILTDALPASVDRAVARYRDDPDRGDLPEDIAHANYWRVLIGENLLTDDEPTGDPGDWLRQNG